MREIDRQANGRWLVRPDAAATAPDGSIAVVSSRPELLAVPESVTVYGRGGDAVETWPFPAKPSLASIAYDGRTIALLSNDRDITLPVALGNFLAADDSPWELLMTTGFIYALPPAAIYYAFRRYMVGGLTAGAVKG